MRHRIDAKVPDGGHRVTAGAPIGEVPFITVRGASRSLEKAQ